MTRLDQLLAGLRAGEPGAIDRVIEHFRPVLLAHARRRLGGRVRELEASDVVQTTLRRAFGALGTIEHRSAAALEGWFLRILENALRDRHRRRSSLKRGGAVEVASFEEGDLAPPGPTRSPLHPDERLPGEAADAAEQAWRLMGGAERELFHARVVLGLPWDEVAQRCGLPSPDAARKRLDGLVTRLRERLRGEAFET